MLFAKSMLMCLIALLTCANLAYGLRPHDVYAEEAAAAGHLMPHANHSMLEEKRESTGDYFPPPGDWYDCKVIAALLAGLVDRIYSADFWQQKMADALILKTKLNPGTLLPVDPPEDENTDVVRVAEALIEVATATNAVKSKLVAISLLAGPPRTGVDTTEEGHPTPAEREDWLKQSDALLQEIMAILAPISPPSHITGAGTYLEAFGHLGDYMRNGILQFKPNADHYNEKFEFVQSQKQSSQQVRTIESDDIDVDPELIPSSSAQNIEEWVTGILAAVHETHEFYYNEPKDDYRHRTALGPWTRLIGRCSKLLRAKTWKPERRVYNDNHLDRGLYPYMQVIERKSDKNSLMYAIMTHFGRRTVVKETPEDLTDPLLPKKEDRVVYEPISW